MIVVLAGHVDHGKTSLVRALTGEDTDRLAEERRRGLTIDLGFAYARQSGQTLGFVDVPGHRRFIHNMVAGVAARQFALLTVAADDGPMPQTREHLQILSLCGIRRGLVALTKCDRAVSDQIIKAERQARALIKGSFLEDAPMLRTSVRAGLGLDALRENLWRAAEQQPAETGGRFRMAVDRAFHLTGAGLVATGTIHAGQVQRQQTLYLFPSRAPLRVRDLRVQGEASDLARTGDRVALNLVGVGSQRIERGCWLSETPAVERQHFACQLQFLADLPGRIRHWSAVHVYHASSHSTARLALLESNWAEPGSEQLAELVTDAPLYAHWGDHLVLRDQGLDRTLGGGRLLTDLPASGSRRRQPARLAQIRAYAADSPQAIIQDLLALGPVSVDAWQESLALTEAERKRLLAACDVRIEAGEAVATGQWQAWRDQTITEVAAWQDANPSAPGLAPNALSATVPDRFRTPILNQLVSEGRLATTAGVYHLANRAAKIPETALRLLQRIKPLLDVDQAPSVGDLAKRLKTPQPQLEAGLKQLARHGLIVQISAKRFYLPERLNRIAARIKALAETEPLSVRRFRDATGIGRNISIELLEFFDGKGFTRRSGDLRQVSGSWASVCE